MHKNLRASLLASALILSTAPFIAISQPANAQVSVDVSFNTFHDRLGAYGTWEHHPRYGDVWRPRGVEADFHPYSRGHWVNTEYGFTWVSDYEWGDIPFHYGRWAYDQDEGWLWVPGYVWAPAWVTWRSDNDYTGWAPMPPDDRFFNGDETNFDVDPAAFYGPRYDVGNIFIFVGTRHFAEPNFRAYIVRRPLVVNIFNRTRNITRITIINNHIVNRSVDVRTIARESRRPVPLVSVRAVLRPGAIITDVRMGRDIQMREREQHPRFNPPGNDQGQKDQTQTGKDNGGNKDNGGGNANGPGKNDKNNNNNNGTNANPPDQTGAKSGGSKDNNGGAGNPANNNVNAPDQTPRKLQKRDGAASPAQTSTPADNGANTMGTTDQTTKHKKSKDTTPADQSAPSSSGSGAMQTQPSGNATPTDNGANNMGTTDQTPKRHKANTAMPADQGAPPSDNNGAANGPGAATAGQGNAAPAATAPATDNSGKAKKGKKKPDTQSDNTTQ